MKELNAEIFRKFVEGVFYSPDFYRNGKTFKTLKASDLG